jgi:integral membrane sensor domain MASE1
VVDGTGPGRAWSRLAFGPFGILALAAAVFGLAFAAVALAPVDHRVAAWWPAAGVSVIALAWAPRDRKALVALTVAIASGVANVAAGRPWLLAAGFGATNALEAVVVAWWLVRGRAAPRLADLEDVTRLLAATVLGLVVMGLGAGLTVWLGEGGNFVVTARTVMASHGAAILVVVPLGMQTRAPRARGRGPEAVAQWVAMIVVAVVIFRPSQQLPLQYLPMPFLVWGALRMGARTVAAQLLLLAVLITFFSRSGAGPFAAGGAGSTLTASLVQSYLVVCALIMLPLAASVSLRLAALEWVAAS